MSSLHKNEDDESPSTTTRYHDVVFDATKATLSSSHDDRLASLLQQSTRSECNNQQNITKTTASSNTTVVQWTVMTTINYGFIDMFYNWFYFYQKLNLNLDMILVAEDDLTYAELQKFKKVHLNTFCYNVTVERSDLRLNATGNDDNYSNESYGWNDPNYKFMMSSRPKSIRQQLEAGRNIIFSDVDFIWKQNPLPYFVNATTTPVPDDERHYHLFSSLDPDYRDGFLQRCGGFYAMVSTEPTRRLVKRWDGYMSKHVDHNQKRYNIILRSMRPPRVKDLPLSHDLFPDGRYYRRVVSQNETLNDNVVAIHFVSDALPYSCVLAS
jgi:hypothetical protein